MQPTAAGLNDMQITLLRMFNRPMNEQEIVDLRDLLTTYYSDKLLTSVEQDVNEKGITDADYEPLRQGKL